eukprot:Pgem_evm1s3917
MLSPKSNSKLSRSSTNSAIGSSKREKRNSTVSPRRPISMIGSPSDSPPTKRVSYRRQTISSRRALYKSDGDNQKKEELDEEELNLQLHLLKLNEVEITTNIENFEKADSKTVESYKDIVFMKLELGLLQMDLQEIKYNLDSKIEDDPNKIN